MVGYLYFPGLQGTLYTFFSRMYMLCVVAVVVVVVVGGDRVNIYVVDSNRPRWNWQSHNQG